MTVGVLDSLGSASPQAEERHFVMEGQWQEFSVWLYSHGTSATYATIITQVDGAQQGHPGRGGEELEIGPAAITMWSHSPCIVNESQVIVIINAKAEKHRWRTLFHQRAWAGDSYRIPVLPRESGVSAPTS